MQVEDIEGVSAVRVRGWQAAYRGMVPQSHLDALTIDGDARMRHEMFAKSDGRVLNLVAEQDGAVVGWAALGPSREEDAEAGDGELLALYVAPDAVGTGVGRALMAEALASAGQRSFRRLVLWVIADNIRARSFYERAGFVADGRTEDWAVDGAVVPEVRYGMDLG
jgi:ribosomal protein S18 acetylase RimI-like enzyme